MFRTLILSAAALSLFSLSAVADTLDEASEQIRTAWESHKSMRAKLRVEAGAPTGSNRVVTFGDGSVLMLRTDAGEIYKSAARMEFAPPMNATMQVETVFDGKSLQLSNDSMGRRSTREATAGVLKGSVPPGGALLLDALSHDAELRRVEDGRFADTEAFVLEGTGKSEGAVPAVSLLRVYIAKETGALLKLELYETDSVMTAQIIQRDFEWDVELDPATLALTSSIPTGAPASK